MFACLQWDNPFNSVVAKPTNKIALHRILLGKGKIILLISEKKCRRPQKRVSVELETLETESLSLVMVISRSWNQELAAFGIRLTENPVHQHFNYKSTADKSTCSICKVQLSGKNTTSLSKFINIIIFCFFLSEISKTRLEWKHYLDPKCSVVDLDSDLVDSNLIGLLDPDRKSDAEIGIKLVEWPENQCCGSVSTCFWASWIRIRIH